MQNSRVIRRVSAGLSRCLSHHRRLCREIDELDRLLFNDEFLRDPRTLWRLQSGKGDPLDVDTASSESEFKSSQTGIRLRSSSPGDSGSLAASEDRNSACPLSASTTQHQTPARRSRVRTVRTTGHSLRGR
ncbi:hypothetical protein KR038_007109 [Drosophila bunnanda]|nr:hypothetical protein KR038_007109 [Drosophila bunnanda]